MARTTKLKCYHGNFDGLRRGLVIATSQSAAATVAGCSLNGFRDYWNDAARIPEQELKAGTLYTKPMDSTGPWIEGRCEIAC